jgi:tripartite-type tricarboxylate transporter receptor subunit TctC
MTMPIMRSLLIAAALVGTSAMPTVAADWPTQQVTFVVPFAPGGGTDTLARLIGEKLTARFHQQFIVENRPGAGTLTAATAVSKAPPDGNTIMMATSSTMAINRTLYKHLPYEPGKDLKVVSEICTVPFVLVVKKDLPVHSVAELVKLAKTKHLDYATSGLGSFHYMMASLFMEQFGLKMTMVPYRGSLPGLTDLVTGQIHMMFSDLAPSYPLIQAGKIRALGVTTAKRAPSAPEIPPLAKVGVPGFDWAAWQSVVVPGGTPRAIREKINEAVNAAVKDPEVTKKLIGFGFDPVGTGSIDELTKFVQTEATRWGKVTEKAGIAGTQ